MDMCVVDFAGQTYAGYNNAGIIPSIIFAIEIVISCSIVDSESNGFCLKFLAFPC